MLRSSGYSRSWAASPISRHEDDRDFHLALDDRSLVLASQPLDFALLPLKLRDQLFASLHLPLRLHASVMPRLSTKYKQKPVQGTRRPPLSWSATR
jgi:hypothetical protein